MAALHVRDVPEETVVALKEQASRLGRSMQQLLVEVLNRAVAAPLPPVKREPLKLNTVKTGKKGSWSRDEMYDD